MAADLTKECLPRPAQPAWCGYTQDWNRAMRARNMPYSTRYNYVLAVTQLATFLAGEDLARMMEAAGTEVADESDAAEDPTDVQRATWSGSSPG